MRSWLVAAAVAGVAAIAWTGAGRAADTAASSGPVFISPMGEPFRGAAPQARWFEQADLDHDGRLTVDEMRKDAARFFATLDLNHDGEIDPEEQTKYETEIAPEIAALLSMSGDRATALEQGDPDVTAKGSDGYPVIADHGGKGRRSRHRRSDDIPFAYLDLTEPVSSADRNFNRGVSLAEFDAAAQQRFHLLDRANLGYLTPDGLKPLLH